MTYMNKRGVDRVCIIHYFTANRYSNRAAENHEIRGSGNMRNQYAESEKQLRELGYEYSHQALTKDCKRSGTISEMRPRSGYEYKRVHTGKSINIMISGEYWIRTQKTYVYRRPINKGV